MLARLCDYCGQVIKAGRRYYQLVEEVNGRPQDTALFGRVTLDFCDQVCVANYAARQPQEPRQ